MIYIIFAPPRSGKTYYATAWALKELKKGKRKVFSNYPIISPKYGSSYVWKPEYASSDIVDSIIFIDEAYRDFNSRNYKSFTSDEHLFFATNGHNGLDIVLIAHSPQRLDTVIREMATIFYYVSKVAIPFIDRPLWFKIEGYPDELTLSQRFVRQDNSYSIEHCFFKKSVANAYNTHFFRKDNIHPELYSTWVENLEGAVAVTPSVETDSLSPPRVGVSGIFQKYSEFLHGYLQTKDLTYFLILLSISYLFYYSVTSGVSI
jgi:Zonular occludens toxin (Zot)